MKLHENVECSVKNGMNFTFFDEGKMIIFKGSSFTGREIVTLDGEVVSDQKSYRRNSIHNFEHAGKNYQIQLVANSIVKGDIDCHFSVNDKIVTSYKLNYEKKKKNSVALFLVIFFGGGLIGFNWSAGHLPTWALVLFICLASLWGGLSNKGRWVCHESKTQAENFVSADKQA
ncbi:hypothetical protein [Bowmanella yangjiangensis]|uniref:Uncharacterized protein n=1 Tax=Bowmanella yangjiangensis TaxID=2811230 RepID=A0ABS3CRP1_9ALTE|nr:hypothetical protein [Bowmanella yangjiangensis]MBN7819784.1 hypothetical protein [Bowmanella yangjiangensis]